MTEINPQRINPELSGTDPQSDQYSRQSMDVTDYTGKRADQRVLYINLYFLKYGTNDKVHAASLLISCFLLIVITLLIISTIFGWVDASDDFVEKMFDWLTNTVLFTIGVAIGGRAKEYYPDRQHDQAYD